MVCIGKKKKAFRIKLRMGWAMSFKGFSKGSRKSETKTKLVLIKFLLDVCADSLR